MLVGNKIYDSPSGNVGLTVWKSMASSYDIIIAQEDSVGGH